MTTATVKQHPMASVVPSFVGVWIGTIETASGRVYSCCWRRDEPPTQAEVLETWHTERKAFAPGMNG